jgi:hypothetical protein
MPISDREYFEALMKEHQKAIDLLAKTQEAKNTQNLYIMVSIVSAVVAIGTVLFHR